MVRKKTIAVLALLIFSFSWTFARDAKRVKIAVWGDSRENRDNACENINSILLNDITDWDFVIHTGDFTSRGSDQDWQRSLGYQGMRQIFVKDKFLMCTSNHDNRRDTYDKYTKGVLPTNNLNQTTHFYSYKKGNVRVLALDAYFTSADTMNMWLQQELKDVKKDEWLIGVWHPPCYEDVSYKRGYLDNCAPWLNMLYQAGGDFILHGHAHIYMRSKPLLPDGTVDKEKGMVHIINGVGGASFKEPQTWSEKTAFTPRSGSFPSITFITIEGNKATVQTIDARPENKLRVIDEWEWTR